MGLLINDELIWLSIPRCASVSIESALLNSNLTIKKYSVDQRNKDNNMSNHMHFKRSELYREFGIHETVCIKRDWFSKWISSLYQLFSQINASKIYTTIIEWENVNNDFIYNTFDTDFTNALYIQNVENWDIAFLRLIKESSLRDKMYDSEGNILQDIIGIVGVLLPQIHFKENKPADYEFDISEIDKFSDFIYNRFGEKLLLQKLNESKPIPNKIVLDDKLKQWVWDNFEKRFEKRNQLI